MNKGQLVAEIVRGTSLNKRESNDALNALLENIAATLKKGGAVRLNGLGTFVVVRRASRKVLNPHTGGKITIKARKAIKFKAGVQLIMKLNNKSKK